MDKVWIKFFKVDKARTREYGGSGIGLSLVKSLVEMHKGKIYVNTEIKKGTEFCIELPIRKIMNNSASPNIAYDMSTESKVEKFNIEFSDIYDLYNIR